jgi:hypothetical protein
MSDEAPNPDADHRPAHHPPPDHEIPRKDDPALIVEDLPQLTVGKGWDQWRRKEPLMNRVQDGWPDKASKGCQRRQCEDRPQAELKPLAHGAIRPRQRGVASASRASEDGVRWGMAAFEAVNGDGSGIGPGLNWTCHQLSIQEQQFRERRSHIERSTVRDKRCHAESIGRARGNLSRAYRPTH